MKSSLLHLFTWWLVLISWSMITSFTHDSLILPETFSKNKGLWFLVSVSSNFLQTLVCPILSRQTSEGVKGKEIKASVRHKERERKKGMLSIPSFLTSLNTSSFLIPFKCLSRLTSNIRQVCLFLSVMSACGVLARRRIRTQFQEDDREGTGNKIRKGDITSDSRSKQLST